MSRLEHQFFYEKLCTLFKPFGRLAVLTADGETVFLQYETLADIGTLPQSAEISHKYLNIQDGDVVLTNDPYSGGTILSSPTLVLGIGTKSTKGSNPAEILVALRMTRKSRVAHFKTIDEEGLRIPPSPLFIKGEVNAPIIEALKGHPLAPPDFIKDVEGVAAKLMKLREQIKRKIHAGELDFSKNTVRRYLDATEQEFTRRIEDMGQGSFTYELDVSSKETIKLVAERFDGHMTFNFTGTSPGETLFLTDSATIGAAIGTTLSLLKTDFPINSGVFARFDVKAPRGSLVNATFPRPLFLGHTDGVNIIANIVARALGQINKKQAWAASGPSHCAYEIAFRDGRVFSDSLSMGSGASESGKGLDGISLWRRFSRTQSIENWEKNYPIQILSTGFRASSGGDGKFAGGLGTVRVVKLLDDGVLRWIHVCPPHKPEGLEGGKSALGPEMLIERADGTKEELPVFGEIKLSKGDVLTTLSPGGGGYGAADTAKVKLT